MTVFLVYWCSFCSNESEDICVCSTEEKAIKKVQELGGHRSGYNYVEIPYID